jgi:hypothetical protein
MPYGSTIDLTSTTAILRTYQASMGKPSMTRRIGSGAKSLVINSPGIYHTRYSHREKYSNPTEVAGIMFHRWQPTICPQKLLCLFIGLILLVSNAQAASITTIQLNNRPAEEVIPFIEPMLDPGDVITGTGFKLFLRASPESVMQVKEIIDVLDTAAKVLNISVFQGSERELKTSSISGNLQIVNGNTNVGIGNNNSAGNFSYNADSVSGDINASSSNTQQSNNPVHQLRVSEGTEGFIQTGDQVPYSSGSNGTIYQNVTTGFYVLPRTRGNMVTLKIRPFRNSLSNSHTGSIETQSANTTIAGRIGEWLPVGGVTEQSQSSQSSIASSSSTKTKSQSSIWIKADLIQ